VNGSFSYTFGRWRTEIRRFGGLSRRRGNCRCRQSAADAGDGDAESGGKEDEKVMTLDEWKAQEDTKRAKADFNIRKPGEGCAGDPQWKKMVVLTKKDKAEDADEEEELVSVDVESVIYVSIIYLFID